MNAVSVHLLGALLAAGVFAAPMSAQTTSDEPKKQEEIIAEVNNLMYAAKIDTAEFLDKIPFAEFLEKLNRQLQEEAKVTVRLDREAFGKEADKILRAEVSLPPFPRRISASVAMRLVWQYTTSRDDIRFTARAGEFIMTTRERSLFTATYELGNLVKSTQRLLEEFTDNKKRLSDNNDLEPFGGFDERADPQKPGEWLVKQILHVVESGVAGDTIRLENGSKIVVNSDPLTHANITERLASMRRMLDLAVVMNARLYSLNRTEYDRHFAPAFVDPADESKHRLVATASLAQMKLVTGMKPILTSDPDKLLPRRQATFLSSRNIYQYQARPGDQGVATDFDGFTFGVRPIVSPDRRCLRLEISHDVAQLIKITKGTMVDFKTGEDVPIELPNVRKTAASGTIDLHDAQPILLRVDYQPTAKDQVWLVLAEPRMYLEGEEEQIRKFAIRPMPLLDEKPKPVEPPLHQVAMEPLPPVELPNTDEMKQLLQVIVARVLTGPGFKECERVVGTPGDKKFALTNGDALAWPKSFRPKVPGFTMWTIDPAACISFKPRLVGLQLATYTRTSAANALQVRVELTLHNAGGVANGGGGFKEWCHVYCRAKRVDNRWTIAHFVNGAPGEILQPSPAYWDPWEK